MGYFYQALAAAITKPTIAAGVVLATAEGSDTIAITNADGTNPAAVDLAFASNSLQATAFDQGTAASPSYVLEGGATRNVTLVRDYGASDYSTDPADNVTESVTALLPDGTFASQTLTVEPYIDIANAAQTDGFCDFNGSSDFLETPHNAAFDFDYDDAFSVACWVNVASAPAGSMYAFISHVTVATAAKGWVLGLQGGSTGKVVSLIHEDSSDSADRLAVATAASVVGSWIHVCMTYDGGGAVAGLNLYIDGVLDSNAYKSGSISGGITNSEPLRIGRRAWTTQDNYLDGEIDDVGIWNVALDAVNTDDIVALAAKTRCHKVQRAALVAYYDFDYVSGSLTNGIEDRSTNGLDMVKG